MVAPRVTTNRVLSCTSIGLPTGYDEKAVRGAGIPDRLGDQLGQTDTTNRALLAFRMQHRQWRSGLCQQIMQPFGGTARVITEGWMEQYIPTALRLHMENSVG